MYVTNNRLGSCLAAAIVLWPFSFAAQGAALSEKPHLPEKAVKVLTQLAQFEQDEIKKRKTLVREKRPEVAQRMEAIIANGEAQGMEPQLLDALKATLERWNRFKSIHSWPSPFLSLDAAYKKYEESCTSAASQNINAKRREVAKYLEMVKSETAKAADLEGALAVQDVITELEARVVASEASKEKKRARPGIPEKARRLLKPQGFHLGGGRKTEATFSFFVKAGSPRPPTVYVGIGSASDDNGDGGLRYAVMDPSGRALSSGFLNGTNIDWKTIAVRTTGQYTIRLEDRDTDDPSENGGKPGNRGHVEVWLAQN